MDSLRSEREKLIKEVANMNVLDGIFSLYYFNTHRNHFGPPSERAQDIDIKEVYSHLSVDQVDEAILKVKKLIAPSYVLGDASLSRDKNRFNELHEQWLKDNPGFSEDSYRKVVMKGCFEAR